MGELEKPAIAEASFLQVDLAGEGTETVPFGDKKNIPTNAKGKDRSMCKWNNKALQWKARFSAYVKLPLHGTFVPTTYPYFTKQKHSLLGNY